MLEVVAALFEQGNRIMMCQRPSQKARGGYWEFPGGKVEPEETLQQALVRECREELDVEIAVYQAAAEVVHNYPDLTIHLTLFRVSVISGELTPLEHSAIGWFTCSEAEKLDLCDADRELLSQLR